MSKIVSTDAATTAKRDQRMGCVEVAPLFREPLLEEPPSTNAPAEQRRRYAALRNAAAAVCGACPLIETCLHRAVVEHDVAGYVAGSDQRQRLELRRMLCVTVDPEDFDTLAGVTGRHHPVDTNEVVRLRQANPHESLDQLAQRLGCSLSTVKRHLRHQRQAQPLQEMRTSTSPTPAEVMAAFMELTQLSADSRRTAA